MMEERDGLLTHAELEEMGIGCRQTVRGSLRRYGFPAGVQLTPGGPWLYIRSEVWEWVKSRREGLGDDVLHLRPEDIEGFAASLADRLIACFTDMLTSGDHHL